MEVKTERVKASVEIIQQVARTKLEIHVFNPGRRDAEAELVLPVPTKAAISGFSFDGKGAEPSAEILTAAEAERIYRAIVDRFKDPAILQFNGMGAVRTGVFPVPAGGRQTLRFTVEHLMPKTGQRIDYIFPRSESVDFHVPWEVSFSIKNTQGVSSIYGPNHDLTPKRNDPRWMVAKVDKGSEKDAGPLHLSIVTGGKDVSASLFAYPDPSIGGGYFLMIAGAPTALPEEFAKRSRDVVLVLDRSGSMAGRKWSQTKAATRQIIAALGKDESFHLLVYNGQVDRYAAKATVGGNDSAEAVGGWLDNLLPAGGTNIHDALVEATRIEPTEGKFPVMLFMTDGLPTVGTTGYRKIRDAVAKGNAHKRRIFTMGLGATVNAPLLEAIGDDTRGATRFVLPGQDIELAMASMIQRTRGPVLANPTLKLPTNKAGATRVTDLLPAKVPDLFEGDQWVMLGRYQGDAPMRFELSGDFFGSNKTFRYEFDLENATVKNAFVARLWASRKVGWLLDDLRTRAAENGELSVDFSKADDEVLTEILRLSREFGILTEYTAFLAREGNRAHDKAALWNNLRNRASETSGSGGVNQSANGAHMKRQSKLNRRNDYLDRKLNRVSMGKVQKLADRAFYLRDGRWIDSRLDAKATADRTILIGSKEYDALLKDLTKANRQSVLALKGEILLKLEKETVRIKPSENSNE